MSASLNDKFNVATDVEIITPSGEVILPENTTVDQNIDTDYEKTRANLHSLLAQGQEALVYALDVAKQSEHPRAFEVVGNLVKQLADVNHQLLDLTEKRQKLAATPKQETGQPGKQITNNNAIFVGSTAELNNMLKNMIGEK